MAVVAVDAVCDVGGEGGAGDDFGGDYGCGGFATDNCPVNGGRTDCLLGGRGTRGRRRRGGR